MELREYQKKAVDDLRKSLQTGHRRPLLQTPCGGGKTVIAGEIIKMAVAKGKRVLFLAPRRELILQAHKTFFGLGIRAGIIMAGELPSTMLDVQIASKDTLYMRGVKNKRMAMPDADIVIADECHLAIAPTWLKVFEHYRESVIIGLTATPARGDGRGLGLIFDDLIMGESIKDLTAQGYLAPVRYFAPAKPDLIGVKRNKDGDYQEKDLATRMDKAKLIGDIVKNWQRLAAGRSTVVFCTNCAHSRNVRDQFIAAGITAEHVDGETPTDERKEIFDRVRSQETTVLTNVYVCVDSKTEILTRQGWAGIDEMTSNHKVANWDNGKIWFSKPEKIMRRKKEKSEKMVFLRTKNRSVRVTENHDMLFGGRSGKFNKIKAGNIVGMEGSVPVSGFVYPELFSMNSSELAYNNVKRFTKRVAGLAYRYRNDLGMQRVESLQEAKKYITQKYSMRYKDPHELTNEECWFIGFWLGDGSCYHSKDGSVRYTLHQSKKYKNIIKRIQECLINIDIYYREVEVIGGISNTPSGKSYRQDAIIWYLSRGTGSRQQKRKGIFHLEKYLKKDGVELYWGLNNKQFDCLLDGLWCADGNHLKKASILECEKNSPAIHSSNKKFMDLLQSLLVCHGYKANLRCYNQSRGHGKMYRLSMHKRDRHQITKNTFKFCDYKDNKERVWCVKTESGNIITRRDGYVTIMGNCSYGLDIPSLEVAVIARPTRNITLYFQTAGRVLRPSPGKTDAMIIDHSGVINEHGFLDAIIPWSLDGDEKLRERKKKLEEKEYKEIVCKNCGAVFSGSRTCPVCGTQLIPKNKPIPTKEGDLHEVIQDAKTLNKNATWDDKIKFIGMLKWHCDHRGMKGGWIAHKYKARFGVWPNDKRLKNAPMVYPDMITRNWITSQHIRYDKRKGKAA